ncbi:anti-sigma factor [Caulobacter sp. 1776]|uniref:anti-sigma factor family protein n=1 Tax=Caulobacter sp. 1776 TaxID=3156420 RepID=UPI003396402A
MTAPLSFDDETLAAYVDGELDPATRTLVEATAKNDGDLAARLKAQQDLKALLTGHYGPIADEPLPERLLETIRGGRSSLAEVVDLAARRRPAPSTKPERPPFRLPTWAGMAACLVVGLAIGRLAMPAAVGLNGDARQTLVASGPLARALDGQVAADTSGPIRIGLTFRDHDGVYCRTFQPNGREGLAGLACRDAGVWRLRVASPIQAETTAAYRTAGSESPPAVLSAVDALIEGAPLDADGEAKALASRWRR